MAASRIALYTDVLATAVAAAEKAGEIIRQVMNSGKLDIVLKGVNDPQTAADRSAQKTIFSILLNKFPKLTVIGEEEDNGKIEMFVPIVEPYEQVLKEVCPSNLKNIREEDMVVWVDPVDGTTEFTKGLVEHVTVLIGLAVNGKPVGGVIHQPYWTNKKETEEKVEENLCKKMGRSTWGTVGGEVGGISATSPSDNQMILATTRSHSNQAVETAINNIGATQVLRVGGAGYKVLLLLEGKAHCYVFPTPGCKRWDTCAPEAVLTAAGGVLTDINGQFYDYSKDTPRVNTGGVLAALKPEVHKRCMDILSNIPTNA